MNVSIERNGELLVCLPINDPRNRAAFKTAGWPSVGFTESGTFYPFKIGIGVVLPIDAEKVVVSEGITVEQQRSPTDPNHRFLSLEGLTDGPERWINAKIGDETWRITTR